MRCSFQTATSAASIKLPARRPTAFPALWWWLALAFAGRESHFFIAADAAMSIQAFQNEFSRGRTDRIRLARPQAQSGGLFHEALNTRQLLDHASRVHGFVELQRSA